MNLDPGAKTPPRQTRHGDRYAQTPRGSPLDWRRGALHVAEAHTDERRPR